MTLSNNEIVFCKTLIRVRWETWNMRIFTKLCNILMLNITARVLLQYQKTFNIRTESFTREALQDTKNVALHGQIRDMLHVKRTTTQ